MEITWLGHACFRLKKNNQTMYVDPFISENPACPIELNDVKEANWVLVTHGHNDHYGDAVEICAKTGATLVSIFEITEDAAKHGVESVEPMNIGGSVDLGEIVIHMTNAQHSSNGLGHQVGFVIEWGSNRIYHAGDTGLFQDMKLIQEFLEPDIGLIPIGDRFTMGPKSASRAVDYLGIDQVIPMHYNTFELVEQDPEEFKKLVGNSAQVVILNPGESHQLLDE